MNGDGQSTEHKDAKKTENKERWAKADIISKFTMPLVVVVAASIFTYCQSQSAQNRLAQEKEEAGKRLKQEKEEATIRRSQEEDLAKERIKADRLTALLKHFVSENPKERLLAVKATEHLIDKEQFPAELSPVLLELYENDENPEVKKSVRIAAENAAVAPSRDSEQNLAKQQLLAQIAPEKVNQIRARVYLHLRRGGGRNQADLLEKNLEEKGLDVPGIDLVSQVPNQNEIRYFAGNSNDEDLKKIQQAFAEMGLQFRLVDLSRTYPNSKARPRHYEVWFGLKTAE